MYEGLTTVKGDWTETEVSKTVLHECPLCGQVALLPVPHMHTHKCGIADPSELRAPLSQKADLGSLISTSTRTGQLVNIFIVNHMFLITNSNIWIFL